MTFPLNALTPRARFVLVLAGELAEVAGHKFIGTEHLLLALAQEGEGVAGQTLKQLDVRNQVMERLRRVLQGYDGAGDAPDFGDEVRVM